MSDLANNRASKPASKAVTRPQAVPTVQIDNEHVKVTEWRFGPGAETGWHRHGMVYVVVPQTTGPLLLETHDGPITSQLTCGVSYTRPVGVEHNVVNPGPGEFVFVEIELCSTAEEGETGCS